MRSDGPRDHELGHKKPPVASRFKRGNTANRRGRPAGVKSLAKLLERALDEPATLVENGEHHKLTKRDLVVRQLVEKSAQADLRAIKLLLDLLRQVDPRSVSPENADIAADEQEVV